jgi:hypothetical protein
MNDASQTIKRFLKAVTPPVLWEAVRKKRQTHLPPPPPDYQGVVTHHSMRWLHEGRFADIYDRYRTLNPQNSPNLTRLRQYCACMFADYAKGVKGDFLSAGISYGVAPRVIYDFVDFGRLGKTYHFIDPFTGVNNPSEGGTHQYNTDPDFVRKQYPVDAPIQIHRELIPDCFPLEGLEALAFVHANTTHAQAEAASLPYWYERLSPGGFIVIDYYSYGKGQYEYYDSIIDDIGASAFSMVTGQGVIQKPIR